MGTADKVLELLDYRGIKKGHFAREALGVAPLQFSLMLRGQRRLPPDFYEKSARYLQVPVEWLHPGERAATGTPTKGDLVTV